MRSIPDRRTHPLFLLLLLAPFWAACADGPVAPTLAGPEGTRLAPAAATAALQATPPGHIRIGVVPSATEIVIGAAGPFTVRDKATGDVLASGSDDAIIVDLLSVSEPRTRAWLQVTCTGSADTRDRLVAEALAAGFEADTEDIGFCTRVMYGSLPPDPSDDEKGAFERELADAGLASTGFWWSARTTVEGETEVRFEWEGTEIVVGSPVVLESNDGLVSIDGRRYRGLAEVWTNSGGTLAGINELPLEDYLYGVVPRELPPEPYGLPEAQKAQAVTARTYALANLGKRANDGYDLLPTTGDQVYGGFDDEHAVSNEAVDATAGIVATYDGRLISTLYHSTSGGWTANSEDVFLNAVPYLRGVPDAERGRAAEWVPSLDVFMRHANPINLRAHAEGDFESDWSVYHRWTVSWTAEEMASILASTIDPSITSVQAIRVVDRADQGRVRRIEFETDAGTFTAEKDAIRGTLRYFDANGTRASLRSTLFFIEPRHDGGAQQPVGWVAYGGGWGHGVGMSQTGAVGMAERGRTYEEILRHYYQGVELEQRD